MLRFRLSQTATLVLQRGDLTKYKGDAIANAANSRMLGGGGVDGAIHRAAGPALLEACKQVPEYTPRQRCPVGEARLTIAGNLPVKYVIHTVGPIYENAEDSAPVLASAYRTSLELAAANNITSVAFPAISCGIFGYPWEEAAQIAVTACIEHVKDPLKEVTFVMFEQGVFEAWQLAIQDAGLNLIGDEEKEERDIHHEEKEEKDIGR